MATQYLAFLKDDQGDSHNVYELLLPLKTELSTEALCLLHKSAFLEKDYLLVEEIGGTCFQVNPSDEIALRNAYACAALTKEKPAIGWLETAFQEGLENISDVLKAKEFDPIRTSALFSEFTKRHS